MQCHELSREQLQKIQRSLRPAMHYLREFQKRMVHRCFPPTDPLVAPVMHAHAEMVKIDLLLSMLIAEKQIEKRHRDYERAEGRERRRPR